MNLLDEALQRLRAQAREDAARPWKPGQQPTDAELLWRYISELKTDLDLTKDDLFLRSNFYAATGQPYYSEEDRLRGEQGIFG